MNAVINAPERKQIADRKKSMELDSKQDPLASIVSDCLTLLSDQELDLIAEDIEAYVLSPEQKETELFSACLDSQFVLEEFRSVFHSVVGTYQERKWIVDGQAMDPEVQRLCVGDIADKLKLLLFQQLTSYTAGLDIDLITALCAMPYESNSAEGKCLAILPALSRMKQDAIAEFAPQDQVELNRTQLRALRKQLNVCGDGALAVYKEDRTGIYKTAGIISKELTKKLPRFQFQKSGQWVFAVTDSKGNSDARLRCCNGELMLPVLNLEKIYSERLHGLGISDVEREGLAQIIQASNECTHGAILIIGDKKLIQSEVNRLASKKRGTRFSPLVSFVQNTKDSKMIKQFSDVDGALFLDFSGNCYGFGVIMDGVVMHEGNNARGSRYNSTKAYTEWVREKNPGSVILGVVRSEDGMINIFDETKEKTTENPGKIRKIWERFKKVLKKIQIST